MGETLLKTINFLKNSLYKCTSVWKPGDVLNADLFGELETELKILYFYKLNNASKLRPICVNTLPVCVIYACFKHFPINMQNLKHLVFSDCRGTFQLPIQFKLPPTIL